MAVLEQRIFNGLGAVDEQAAIEALCSWATQLPRLFLPMKTMVDAALHDGGSTSFTLVFPLLMVRPACYATSVSVASSAVECSIGFRRSGEGVTHAPNIFRAGYEFDGGGATIS